MDDTTEQREGAPIAAGRQRLERVRNSGRRGAFWIRQPWSLLLTVGLIFVLFVAVRHLYPRGILFYQGIAICTVVSVSYAFVAWFERSVPKFIVTRDAAIVFLLSYAFLITVPTNADRSFSLFLLQRLEEAPVGLSTGELESFYAIDFLQHGGLDQRLNEQIATGTLVAQEGRYLITAKGRMITQATLTICWLFVCRHRAGEPATRSESDYERTNAVRKRGGLGNEGANAIRHPEPISKRRCWP